MSQTAKVVLWILGVGALVLIPASEGRLFQALSEKFSDGPAPVSLDDLHGTPAKEAPAQEEAAAPAKAVSPEKAEAAREAFQRGLAYFQEEKYPEAWKEWLEAQKLDPGNKDVKTGLARLQNISPSTRPK